MTAEQIMTAAVPAVHSRGDGCIPYRLPDGAGVGSIFRVEHAGTYCYYRVDEMPADGRVATGYACSWPNTPDGVVYLGRARAGFGPHTFTPAPDAATRLEPCGSAV